MTKTSIEWTSTINADGSVSEGRVWNPVTGCDKVSQGCKNCYAETIATRFWGDRKFTDVKTHEDRLSAPLKWRKPVRVFVNSMSDLFHESVPTQFIAEVFAIMFLAPKHTFQILTKRPERMVQVLTSFEFFTEYYRAANRLHHEHIKPLEQELYFYEEMTSTANFPLKNVWLGVSIEDQATADQRIPILLKAPAVIHWLSCEPLLGPVDLTNLAMGPCTINVLNGEVKNGYTFTHIIDWIIVGGESGPHARPMHPDWVRSLRDQCYENKIPFFFKQWGEYNIEEKKVGKSYSGRELDGIIHNDYPRLPEENSSVEPEQVN